MTTNHSVTGGPAAKLEAESVAPKPATLCRLLARRYLGRRQLLPADFLAVGCGLAVLEQRLEAHQVVVHRLLGVAAEERRAHADQPPERRVGQTAREQHHATHTDEGTQQPTPAESPTGQRATPEHRDEARRRRPLLLEELEARLRPPSAPLQAGHVAGRVVD